MVVLTLLRSAIFGLCLTTVNAVTVNETSTLFTFANDRISFDILKSNGYIRNLLFDDISVLGTLSGNAGQLYSGTYHYAFLVINMYGH